MMSLIRSVVVQSPVAASGLFVLMLFLAVFVGAMLWIFRKGGREVYEYIASIPSHESDE